MCRAKTMSTFPEFFLPTTKSEEFLCSCGGCASDFFQRNSTRSPNLFRHQSRVGRLAAFSAIRNRCKIGAIGLDHETVEWNFRRDFANLFSVFEGHDSGERNEMAEAENFVGLVERAAETMKHSADLASVIAQDRQRIVPSVALMNYDVHSQFHREIEKLLEQLRLFGFVSAVLNRRFDLFFSLALERVENLNVFSFLNFDARRVMIIQADFANRDHARILCQLTQRCDDILCCFSCVSRVNADHGKNIWIFSGKIDSAAAALHRSADGNDASHPGCSRAPKDILNVWLKIRIIEMCVSLY